MAGAPLPTWPFIESHPGGHHLDRREWGGGGRPVWGRFHPVTHVTNMYYYMCGLTNWLPLFDAIAEKSCPPRQEDDGDLLYVGYNWLIAIVSFPQKDR